MKRVFVLANFVDKNDLIYLSYYEWIHLFINHLYYLFFDPSISVSIFFPLARIQGYYFFLLIFTLAETVKNLLAIEETKVRSLGREDPLEKEMITHSSVLAWRIPWTQEHGGLQSMGSQRVRQNWTTNTFTFFLPQLNFSLFIYWCGYSTIKYKFRKVLHYRQTKRKVPYC